MLVAMGSKESRVFRVMFEKCKPNPFSPVCVCMCVCMFVCVCVHSHVLCSPSFSPSPPSRRSNPIRWCYSWKCNTNSSPYHCHLLYFGYSRHLFCICVPCIQFHLQEWDVSYKSCCIHAPLHDVCFVHSNWRVKELMFGLSQHTCTIVSVSLQ